jgi:hypothetical protein
MIQVLYYGNMFRSFFRPSSGQLTNVKGAVSRYYVLWDPMTHCHNKIPIYHVLLLCSGRNKLFVLLLVLPREIEFFYLFASIY